MTDVPATMADVSGTSAVSRKWLVHGGRIALTFALLAGWEYGARTLGPLFFAPPLATAERLWALALSGQMFSDIMATLRVAVAGFAIAGVVGVLLPFLLRRSARATEAVEPAIMFTMGIPKYALAPWLILWFGIGDMPKLVVVALVVFYIVFITTFAGIRGVDRRLISMARVIGASERRSMRVRRLRPRLPEIRKSSNGRKKIRCAVSFRGGKPASSATNRVRSTFSIACVGSSLSLA